MGKDWMDNQRLDNLLDKYLRNSCTEAERVELMKILASLPDTEIQKLMSKGWENINSPITLLQKQETEDLYKTIKVLGNIHQDISTQGIAVILRSGWFQTVAALLLVTFTVFFLLYWKHNSSRPTTAPIAQTWNDRTQVRLPDGTLVTLNKGSSLHLASDFGKIDRTVYLLGEGYFMVKKDTKKRFVVLTGEVRTEVLGTSFNINAYNPDQKVTVTVTEGRVRVRQHALDKGVLGKNEQVVLSPSLTTRPQTLLAKQTELATAWQQKDLYFTDVTMEEAAKLLEQRFGCKVVFENDALKKCRFSGTFPDAESMEPVLAVLCTFNHAHYKKQGNQWLIAGSGC